MTTGDAEEKTRQSFRLKPGNSTTIALLSSTRMVTMPEDEQPRSPGGSLVSVPDRQEGQILRLQAEIRQLRAKIRQKDEVIAQHATEWHKLRNILCNVPPQIVYTVGVTHPG